MRSKLFKCFLLLCLLMPLTGTVLASTQPSSLNLARVRVYQNAEITLYPGSYCYGVDDAKTIHATSSSFGIFSTHKRVGMQVTSDIDSSYNEYQIAGDQAVTVSLKWTDEKNGVRASCGPLGVTFYPQSGKDYDVSMGYGGACFIQIRQLFENLPGKAGASLLAASPSFPCVKH